MDYGPDFFVPADKEREEMARLVERYITPLSPWHVLAFLQAIGAPLTGELAKMPRVVYRGEKH